MGGAVIAAVIAYTAAGGISADTIAKTDPPLMRYCAIAPHDAPCPHIPLDQTDFDSSFEYINVVNVAQDPFDVFSWQAFTALNWSAAAPDRPFDVASQPNLDQPLVWQSFETRQQVIGPNAGETPCPPDRSAATLQLSEFVQSDDNVLIDRHGNYVLYDVRMNDQAASYIRDNRLNTIDGQRAFTANNTIDFPQGSYGTAPNTVRTQPSMTLKFAWRILLPDEDRSNFIVRAAQIAVPASSSRSRRPMCIDAMVGLVGMHIVSRTQSGNGDQWLWSTFEHVDNAPAASNARNINSIFAEDLFPDGCLAPDSMRDKSYAFYDRTCTDCPANTPVGDTPMWADARPFAVSQSGVPLRSTNVLRCWKIFSSTQAINTAWQSTLSETVLSNYMLVSTQWRGAQRSPLSGEGELPRFLSNVTMETFVQTSVQGTCLGCHATARTVDGTVPSDFTFLLSHAQ